MTNREKREKVIKALECCNPNEYQCSVCPYDDGYETCARCKPALHSDAIALLKAQEPVKPIRYQEGRWFKTWRCGACGSTLVFRNGEDKPNYCTDCGRKVWWE